MDSDKHFSSGGGGRSRSRVSSLPDETAEDSTSKLTDKPNFPLGKARNKFLAGRTASFKLRRHKSLNVHRAEGFEQASIYADHLNKELSHPGVKSLSMDVNSLESSINTFNLINIHNINSGVALIDHSLQKVPLDTSDSKPTIGVNSNSNSSGKEIESESKTGTELELGNTKPKVVKFKPSHSHQNSQPEELALTGTDAGHTDMNVSHHHLRTSSNASEHMMEDEENRIRRVKQKQIRTLNHGIRRFNLNPKKGLKYLQENGVIKTEEGDMDGNAKRVARFLRTTRGLNKEQIGLILGDEDKQCVRILHEYMHLFNFTEDGATIYGLEIGLRKVLALFKPPGEGQKIDRILEAFSKKFVIDNKSSFQEKTAKFNADTTYIIAYLIIMLNVDLHNPNNANRRMNKKTFVERCRKLDDGKDLPATEVGNLYTRILENEIKLIMDRDDISGNLFTNPDKCSWLMKKGSGSMARWSKRWFILSENTLYYFRNSEDVEPQGFIPLENIEIVSKDSGYQKKFNSKQPVPYEHARPRTPSKGSSQEMASLSDVQVSSKIPSNGDADISDTDSACGTLKEEVGDGEGDSYLQKTDSGTECLCEDSPPANHKNTCSALVSNSASSISTNASSLPQSNGNTTSFKSYPGSWPGSSSKWLWSPRSHRGRMNERSSFRNVMSRFRYISSSDESTALERNDSLSVKRVNLFQGFGCAGGARNNYTVSSYTFELRPCDPLLKVKSAKVSRHGDLVLGQHRTIKLRADSRQEAQDWIGVLNQKRMFHNTIETIRGRSGGN